MRSTSLLVVLLSVGASVSAQQMVRGQWKIPETMSVGCPVNFGASLNARATVQATQDAKDKDRNAKLVELRIGQLNPGAVVGASVMIHGLTENARSLLIAGVPKDDVEQTFRLEAVPDAAGLVERGVWVSKMTVRWAEVTELRYADGSVWRPSKDSYCRAAPSLFQPVIAEAR